MREDDDKRWSLFVQDCTKGQVYLWEAWGTTLAEKRMTQAHVFRLNLSLDARLTCSAKRISTDELEILGGIVHFLLFHVCYDDVNIVPAYIVHPS